MREPLPIDYYVLVLGVNKFRIYFSGNWQWVDVYLWDVHPTTFVRWDGGRWGYFEKKWEHPRKGLFGEMHFVRDRLRIDTISHEIDHLRLEWIWANRTAFTSRNEERLIAFKDIILWRFLKKLSKLEPDTADWCKTLSEL